MGMADPFGRALLDHHRGEQSATLYQTDGEERLTHPVGDFYFSDVSDQPAADWTESWLDGPLLDVGAGAGRDALVFQERFETVALEKSSRLVDLLAARGVEQAVQGDMFDLPAQFEPGRFQSLLVVGTQIGLAGSIDGLQSLLNDFDAVTTSNGTVVLDAYDPAYEGAEDMLGFQASSDPGIAHRIVRYEYEGDAGEALRVLLFDPDRLREATDETPWTVADIERPHDSYYYRAALEKSV